MARTRAEYLEACRVDKTCPECGSTFRVKKGEALKRTYCKPKCRSDALKKRVGALNPAWKGGTTSASRYASNLAYKHSHPGMVAASNRATRARRAKAPGKHSAADIEALRIRQEGLCAACMDGLHDGGHVDHVIPLARGGTNFVGNIQLLCASCNLLKHVLLPIEFKWRVLQGKTEDAEQSKVMAWAHENGDRLHGARMLFHAANGGHRTKRTAAKMQSIGVKKGVPDLCLPCPRHGFHALFIEMKVGRNKPTKEQLAWHAALRAAGNRVDVCYGSEAAIAVLEEYLA